MHTVARSSVLPISAPQAWARAMTPEGINYELAPWLRMTMPKGLRGRALDDAAIAELGRGPLGRSWILLFGVLPVDFDDIAIAELDPGRRFLERSRTLAFGLWQHEREIESLGSSSCRISDRLGFELRAPLARVPGIAALGRAIVGALFRHRHRRLQRFARRRASTMPG
jgi:hypothetical protein